MRHAWNLPPQEMFADLLSRRATKEVVLEYDGPQLMILEDGPDLFLALAVDGDEEVARWIHTPVSSFEIEALTRGAEPLRTAFLKPLMILVDVDLRTGRLRQAWEIDSRSVPEDALPERGALLPHITSQESLASEVDATPAFRFEGKGTAKNRVTFGDLSALTSKIQVLWNALASDSHNQPLVLSAVGTATGSLKILVHTDDLVRFRRVAESYRRLVWATDDKEAVRELLSASPEGQRIASTYSDYLKTLEQHGVEVMAEWSGGAAFVSHGAAQRTRESLRASGLTPDPVETVEIAHQRGYFEGFFRLGYGKFEFYDVDSGETHQGTIARTVRSRAERDFVLTLGRVARRYQATFRVRRRGIAVKFTLLDYSESPDE
jgi:hypothetical protein